VLNAEDGAAAGVIRSYAGRVLERFARDEQAALGVPPAPAVEIRTRGRFNPGGSYVAFMSVGLLALLMTMVGTLITAQNLAREKELGTIEQLNATPISRGQFIAGKLLPFWLLGLVEICFGLLVIRFVLGVELVGQVPLAILGAAIYLACALGIGLLISTAVDTQQQAMFVVFFVLMIFLFMGGLFTPVSSMPGWAQAIAEANPIKHFIVLLRAVLLKGAGAADVLRELTILTLFAAGALSAAILRYKKTVA
jgi:ABC-2 type transport system permease protein